MSTAGPEIKALISLIDDPDDRIYSQVRTKLLEFGEEIIPALESEWESNEYGLVFQSRIETLIHEIQFSSVKDNLVRWIENGSHDLLEGVLIINRFQYPDLDEDRIKKRIHQLKQDVWLELNDNLTAFEQIRVINHILFDVYGFSGNKKNFHSPQNSFLNQVLDTGKGNPLMLSVIYLLVCRPLDLPVYGVNL
ncbi:MAG: transglutaminase-like domain-containing protein, partial [Flavobacteriales bacterium]